MQNNALKTINQSTEGWGTIGTNISHTNFTIQHGGNSVTLNSGSGTIALSPAKLNKLGAKVGDKVTVTRVRE